MPHLQLPGLLALGLRALACNRLLFIFLRLMADCLFYHSSS